MDQGEREHKGFDKNLGYILKCRKYAGHTNTTRRSLCAAWCDVDTHSLVSYNKEKLKKTSYHTSRSNRYCWNRRGKAYRTFPARLRCTFHLHNHIHTRNRTEGPCTWPRRQSSERNTPALIGEGCEQQQERVRRANNDCALGYVSHEPMNYKGRLRVTRSLSVSGEKQNTKTLFRSVECTACVKA